MSGVRGSTRSGRTPGAGVAPVRAERGGQRPGAAAPEDSFEQERGAPLTVRTLQRGSTGPEVKALQDTLVKRGFLRPADVATGPGVYGPRTEAAVRRFQAAAGLPVTGVAGATTRSALLDTGRLVTPGSAGARPPAPAPTETPTNTQPIPAHLVGENTFTEETTVALDLTGR